MPFSRVDKEHVDGVGHLRRDCKGAESESQTYGPIPSRGNSKGKIPESPWGMWGTARRLERQ